MTRINSGEKEDLKFDMYDILENIDNFDSVVKIDLGETKLKIEDECKLVFTVGRLGADEKTIEVFGVVNSMTKKLRLKLLRLIVKDLFVHIGQSAEQIEAEDEENLAKVYNLMDQSSLYSKQAEEVMESVT